MRNLFHGGPLDRQVILTDALINDHEMVASTPLEEYYADKATIGQEDGIDVRNWHWRDSAEKTAASLSSETPGDLPVIIDTQSDLLELRKHAKASRQQLADESGLTVSAIARLENKGGGIDEVAAYTEGLERLRDRNS